METLAQLGGETWFQLGDRDLALHLYRTQRLKEGASLATVTADVCGRLGIRHAPAPMCEETVSTIVATEAGDLSFQDYFVRHRCAVEARNVRYVGADAAKPSELFERALRAPDLAGIVIAPSNPILSIGPILALPGVRQIIVARAIPVVAVSPLIGGKAVKGPADKLMAELGHAPGNDGIAAFYGDMLDGLLIDRMDRAAAERLKVRTHADDIMMKDAADRERLARLCIEMLDGVV